MKDCKIVQDLLPSYIEKLTSKETSEYVKEHLETCKDCTSVYKDMKADLKLKNTTPKAEIDYMKKARKKMRIADKIALIVLILLIIFILLFWREIFSFICYANICNRYLAFQEEILSTEKYSVFSTDLNYSEWIYCTPEMTINKSDGQVMWLRGRIKNSDIEETELIYSGGFNKKTLENEYTSLAYVNKLELFGEELILPYYPYFSFEHKSTFWELMSTFSDIRNIRIVEDKYQIDFRDDDTKVYLNRYGGFILFKDEERLTLHVGKVSEEDLALIDLNAENIRLQDYDSPERNKSTTEKITTKLSNCDQEAGSIVAYDFKISKEESSSLKFLGETFEYNEEKNTTEEVERIKSVKIMNNVSYKKLQERWSGLRDMTDEDFINYTAIIVVDTDNTKELHYKNTEYKSIGFSDVYFTESEPSSDYQYSASLVIIPNNMLYPTGDYTKGEGYEVHIANN